MIRTTSTKEVMVLLQFYSDNKKNRELLLNFLIEQFPNINSLLFVVNNKANDTIYDQEVKTYYGNSFITEKMEGLEFKINAKSFYQTNSDQAYELYKIIRKVSDLKKTDIVYDLYTGTGTIALFISKSVKKVVGIDSVEEGIKAAWNQINGSFLLALLTGIGISVLTFSKVITHLLETQPILVWSFFFGLIIASITLIWKEITSWKLVDILFLLIGITVSYYITIARPVSSPDSYWYIFLSGFIAIIAMILPGISGAFILLLMGSYETVIGTINQFREGLTTANSEILTQVKGHLDGSGGLYLKVEGSRKPQQLRPGK